ncbi:hypothetical protein [uncultured Desulfobulbus sp.]|uniref:hypothetical protein n=1 Tax=uncultured Desulfobulbus sp. TaxID=239745 RepID=UPI0029C6426E|nr:hypothetical protein [uncultured Desulfobulbus sp.]
MKYMKGSLFLLVVFVILGAGISAFAFLGFGNSVSWKEEVLLHDGQKIIVERSQSYGGRHEIGQSAPIKEQAISFTLPNTNKIVKWTSEYSKDIGRANFDLLALHILKSTPYIVASPNLCLSYNKWGRPNPPYVIFKYTDATWQRIPLEKFPAEFQTINATINTKGHEKEIVSEKLVTTERVRKFNNSLSQPEYKTILREPKKPVDLCPEEIQTQSGGWLGIDWFSRQPNYEACMKVCNREKVSPEHCPCDRIFNKNSEEQ